MKRFAFLIIGCFITILCFAQGKKNDDILTIPDQMPEFSGGSSALSEYLKANIQYPKKEKEAGITGKVFVQFVVKANGCIADISEKAGVKDGQGLTKEAMRLVKKMPKWNPGLKDGEAVNVQLILPIYFTLSGQTHTVIDEKASKIPDSLTKNTQSIADFMVANFKGENDLIRAIFVWVTNNIQYDVENMFAINFYEKNEEKIAKALKDKKGICENYALVFQNICTQAGIKTYMVYGYTKQNGFTDYIPHVWCAAFVEKKWYMFDPTWGSGYIDNGRFIKKLRNDYFKIPPSILVVSHQPFDYLWQFLNYPITASEFYTGKTQENKSKPFFNYVDSIAAYEKLPRIDQLKASASRIEANGLKNSMIFDRLQHIKLEIENYYLSEKTNKYNSAVADYNKSIKDFNVYIAYKNKMFLPSKSDSAIQDMLLVVETKLNNANSSLNDISNPSIEMSNMMEPMKQSIQDFANRLKEENKFLSEYVQKNKVQRKLMFMKKN